MRSVLSLLLGLAVCVLFSACNREKAREPGLEWKGVPLEITGRWDKPTAEQLAANGFSQWFPDLGAVPRRLLTAKVSDPGTEGLDSVSLLDFGDEAAAYVAFQELAANPDDFAEGFAVGPTRVYFRRGPWVGAVQPGAWRGIAELLGGLSVPGVAVGTPYAVPRQFASLLHQGRVEGSERILTREFMGIPFRGRVYAARLNCQGDTAWVYASPDLKTEFGFRAARALNGNLDSSQGDLGLLAHSPGFSPLLLRFSGAGMAGVEGCFDDSLTNFWIKMQARALKKLK
jgi:hypothetical protein